MPAGERPGRREARSGEGAVPRGSRAGGASWSRSGPGGGGGAGSAPVVGGRPEPRWGLGGASTCGGGVGNGVPAGSKSREGCVSRHLGARGFWSATLVPRAVPGGVVSAAVAAGQTASFFAFSFPSVTFCVPCRKSCVLDSARCSGNGAPGAAGPGRNTCRFKDATGAPHQSQRKGKPAARAEKPMANCR